MTSLAGEYTDAETELTKIQELMYELRVGEIMTRQVVTVSPDSTMKTAKGLMRDRRISGLPVLSGDALVGLVSVEDVIRWLEQGPRDALVREWMTEKLVTVRSNEPAVQAINKFGTYHIGRLPVLDQRDKLEGIVTPGDIVDRVVRILDSLYREAEPRIRQERSVFEELASQRTTIVLRYVIPPRDFESTGIAATRIKRLLEALRVDPRIVRRVGIAAYEAEMNLSIHAANGGEILAHMEPEQLVIEVHDNGPGIADIEAAMTPGYSTAPDWIRELGFGAGMGLNNIRNCADSFSIKSTPGVGTDLQIVFNTASRPQGRAKS